MELLYKQGAEARLYKGIYEGQKCIIKERFLKKYRHPDLDNQIRKERMRSEIKALGRCSAAGIKVPKIYFNDMKSYKIYMEYFEKTQTVKEYINSLAVNNEPDLSALSICEKLGNAVGTMHVNNIIHGDLTTSNFLIDEKNEAELISIDFGLSFHSSNLEDKAVDLYVLERALLSAHNNYPQLFSLILEHYQKKNANYHDVLSKLEEVRARGRKRSMVG